MAKTKEGRKIVHVREHKRAKPGGERRVRPVKIHKRSTPE